MRACRTACCSRRPAGHNGIAGVGVALVKCEYQPGLVDAVEERAQRVVVALRDRIELVVVAAGALERQAQHRRAERVDAIRDVFLAELLLDAAAFVRLAVQAVERGRQALLVGRVRQQIAGQLPGEETVVGQVLREGADDPVAPRRHVALDVGLVAVGIGVAREIEPVHRHALAVGRRGEVAIDGALVGAGPRVGEERVDLGRRRRQSGQVEGEPAQQHRPIGRRLTARGARGRAGPAPARRSGCR